MRYAGLILVFVATQVFADSDSIGPNGIGSKSTGLDGTGIEIGQGEFVGRSGKAGYDTPENSAANTVPAGVYYGTGGGMDLPNSHVAPHATEIAGVMIGDANHGALYEGVAPKANLHSQGITSFDDDSQITIEINRIATLSGADIKIRAINLSIQRPLQELFEDTNGKSKFAQYIDWSARHHDILYAVAWGNNTSSAKRTPSDNYNGITVAASDVVDIATDPKYRKFADVNATEGDAVGDRTSISLLAPGANIAVLGLGNANNLETGTSVATPHVTATVALLQQYAQQQMDKNPPNPRFIPNNSQRHEVMKAVLLNSADKLARVHGSTRDVVDTNGTYKWTDSPAYTNATIPLENTWAPVS